jgi:hypothetical protein
MTAPSLADVQRWMKARILPGRAPADGGPATTLLAPQRGTPGQERIAVYAGGYLTRIREALAEVYEAVRHVLGDRAFGEMAEAYAAAHPSREYNLSFAGRHLPEFLAGWPRTQALPFLPDVARLERLVCLAFHAFDEPPLDPARLAGLSLESWQRVRLVCQPSLGLLASDWPVLDLWAARTTPREQINLKLVNRPQRVLVFRQGLRVRCEGLEPLAYAVLEGLRAGRTLGAVCEEAAASVAAAEGMPTVAAWFAGWAQRGLFTRCEGLG